MSHTVTPIDVALLTGGQDPHYALGLATALHSKGVSLDVIGSDEVDTPFFHETPGIRFLNLRRNQRSSAGLVTKACRVSAYYMRLIRYAASADAVLFHILWNNRLETFDRTLLLLYYRALGKKLAFTAHNVNQARRDRRDTALNRLTLRLQYRLLDHIFVHTTQMKHELIKVFGVAETRVSVIPYGLNTAVPDTQLTSTAAKERLGVRPDERTILFFGHIAPYKGLDYLVAAFNRIASLGRYRLIIAGLPKRGCEAYVRHIQTEIASGGHAERIIQRIEYIPDHETEVYFKAADVLVLPYREIFQSGVLFFGYSFGLPVIAADVGALKEAIVPGETGFVFAPEDPADLAATIEAYFGGPLFRELESRRQRIRDYARSRHSWDAVGEMTRNVYARLLGLDGDGAGSSPSIASVERP